MNIEIVTKELHSLNIIEEKLKVIVPEIHSKPRIGIKGGKIPKKKIDSMLDKYRIIIHTVLVDRQRNKKLYHLNGCTLNTGILKKTLGEGSRVVSFMLQVLIENDILIMVRDSFHTDFEGKSRAYKLVADDDLPIDKITISSKNTQQVYRLLEFDKFYEEKIKLGWSNKEITKEYDKYSSEVGSLRRSTNNKTREEEKVNKTRRKKNLSIITFPTILQNSISVTSQYRFLGTKNSCFASIKSILTL